MVVGGMFITLQVLSYNGFIKVNYDKLKSEVEVKFSNSSNSKFIRDFRSDLILIWTVKIFLLRCILILKYSARKI